MAWGKKNGTFDLIHHLDNQRAALLQSVCASNLFAKPPTVEFRILEQFFRSLKRAHRRRTGNAASGRMLRTILAETPLVQNLQNSHYMTLLLNRKSSLEEVFAEIEIGSLRQAFREAQINPESIPPKLKPIIAMPDFPERFVQMVEKGVA